MNKDIRDSYFDTLYSLGERNKDVVILTNDMDVFSLMEFKNKFPNQFINTGVAEQNMINIAAGLAESGKQVFVYGIASFITFRCFEQIKFNICSMNLPVTIIGIGVGISFPFDGPTHHGMQDIGVMRMLPEMSIYNPCDAVSAAQICMEPCLSPRYVRIEKGILPGYYETSDGPWKKIRNYSEETCILSTGYMTHKAVKIADELLTFSVFDVCCLKPICNRLLCQLSQFKTVVCLEEHSVTGGLGSILAEISVDREWDTKVKRIGLPDAQFLKYGQRYWFHEEFGLGDESIRKFMECYQK